MDQSRSQQPPVGVQADLCSKDQKETKRPLQHWNFGRKSKANLAVFPLADLQSESQQGNWLYQAPRICWWGHVTRKVWPVSTGPQVTNTEYCIKQTQSQVIVRRNTAKPQWGKNTAKKCMGRTKWGREKKIIFVPDPGGMLHLPPAVFLFLEPNFWGRSRAPDLVSRCVLIVGALGRWCSPGSAGFPVLKWGGLPSLGFWVPNLWTSWPGQFRGLLWRGAWIHIEECCSDWATCCWNCNKVMWSS